MLIMALWDIYMSLFQSLKYIPPDAGKYIIEDNKLVLIGKNIMGA